MKENHERSQRGQKTHTYRGTMIKITLDYYSEIMQARRAWSEIFSVYKKRIIKLEFGILQNYSFKNEKETFSDKSKLRNLSPADLLWKK